MLSVDYTLFIQIANFLVLLFILNLVLYKPIRKILLKRKEEVHAYEESIGEFESKSEEGSKDFSEGMITARKEGFQEKEGLKGQGLEEEKALIGSATASALEKIDEAKKNIDQTIQEAWAGLEKESATFSKELAEKILGRSL
jgi:F-type H+-transporting ATPase subunit b